MNSNERTTEWTNEWREEHIEWTGGYRFLSLVFHSMKNNRIRFWITFNSIIYYNSSFFIFDNSTETPFMRYFSQEWHTHTHTRTHTNTFWRHLQNIQENGRTLIEMRMGEWRVSWTTFGSIDYGNRRSHPGDRTKVEKFFKNLSNDRFFKQDETYE